MTSAENAMDPNASTSEQRSSSERTNVECVRRCEEVVSQYQKGELTKSNAVLTLHQNLLDAPSVKSGTRNSLPIALRLYLTMLDEAKCTVDNTNLWMTFVRSQ